MNKNSHLHGPGPGSHLRIPSRALRRGENSHLRFPYPGTTGPHADEKKVICTVQVQVEVPVEVEAQIQVDVDVEFCSKCDVNSGQSQRLM